MDLETTRSIDELTTDKVIISTVTSVELNESRVTVGDPERIVYVNSEDHRQRISETYDQNIVNAVFAMWGDTATIVPISTDTPEE